MDQALAIERRRRNLRIVLFAIILITLPFYCVGFFLWATAPAGSTSQQPLPGTATATFTPLAVASMLPSNTPFGLITPIATSTPFGQLQPTPGQFFPPAVTRFLSPTPFFFPTLTLAPTLTPFVLPTIAPATQTPLPTIGAPTETPIIPTTEPPTSAPPPTDAPPPTLIPFETATPGP
jgi:hypothetical protein